MHVMLTRSENELFVCWIVRQISFAQISKPSSDASGCSEMDIWDARKAFVTSHFLPTFKERRGCCLQRISFHVYSLCPYAGNRQHQDSGSCASRISYDAPLKSLDRGTWFKLICGASFHDAPSIHNISTVYTAAGVDCIDVACDRAIIQAARSGIKKGLLRRECAESPLLMVSVNAGSDPHFRKAIFDPVKCPPDCRRPCEKVCPADAINETGVILDRCYGCGRCIPVCPLGIVDATEKVFDTQFIANVLSSGEVDAIEIHLGQGQELDFYALWQEIGAATALLKIVAVSLPDLGDDDALQDGLSVLWRIMRDGGGSVVTGQTRLIWQADGRPMSGDIGRGTAKAAVRLATRIRKVLTRGDIPGDVQLAGGTNDATVPLMAKAGIKRLPGMSRETTAVGIAVGGYARKVRLTFCSETHVLPRPKNISYLATSDNISLATVLLHPFLRLSSKP